MIRKLNISGIVYSVKYKKTLMDASGNECYGLLDHEKSIIYLRPDRPKDALFGDMLHEALHAYFPYLSEKAVAEFERCLTQFLLDNKFVNPRRLI